MSASARRPAAAGDAGSSSARLAVQRLSVDGTLQNIFDAIRDVRPIYTDWDRLPVQSISVLTSLCLVGQGLLITDCQASDFVRD